jgi:predicted anti-sigma-YlaC factor YlaD
VLSCREIVQLVTEYLEGAMPAEERLRFERHVAICPPCRGFLSQMRGTLRVSGELSEESLSPETRELLLHAFRDWRSGE